jgi:glycosyltransferase involved in cell wall biosynthesis
VLIKYWKGCPLVYDTHELETETAGLTGIRKKLSALLERRLIGNADAICVVGAGIANWYSQAYPSKHTWIVKNVPYLRSETPKRTGLLRRALRLTEDPNAIVFLYQGVLGVGRGIEILVDAFASSDCGNRHLVFVGYGALEAYVKCASSRHQNIHFVSAVPPEKLNEYTVDADVGLSLIENICLSYYLCAPNKMYEYASCGVPPVVSHFPEMARFVDEFQCGWKIEPDALSCRRFVESLNIEEIASKRFNALRAREKLCWELEEPVLLSMYQSMGLGRAR